MEISSQLPAAAEAESQFAGFHPTVWGDHFITSPSIPPAKLESLKLQEGVLKEEVRKMIEETTETLELLELIDRIQRLGVAYHFEDEINGKLNTIQKTGFVSNDLYSASLHFRLLRQQRYPVSCDVFERFLNEGEFSVSLLNNVETVLSLYEASHLCLPGEEILVEAKKVTKSILRDISLGELDPHLVTMVSSALNVPLIRRVDRPRTKLYLSIYEKESTFNQVLLNFAKLDFIILQALYQDELRNVSTWWRNLRFSDGFQFARDRIVECFFWILSVYHEPCYSRARVMMTKLVALISLTDDIYDTYGTVEELQLLTDAIMCWKLESVGILPNYMQKYFRAFYMTFEEFEGDLAEDNYSFRLKYAIEELKKMVQGYLQEAKWESKSYLPKLQEHLSISIVTSGYSYLACVSYVGMEEAITDNFFQWVCSMPPILEASNIIGRIMNDIASKESEQSKKQVASTVQCFMVEHKCSKEEACEKLMKMVDDAWKIVNREFMSSTNISMGLIRAILNITNFSELVYDGMDHYTDSNLNMKDYITAILIEPVQLDLKL